MSSAEHVIESLIIGMREGRNCEDILNEPVHKANLGDCFMSEEEAIRIACHVVYGLYDGRFPDQDCFNCEFGKFSNEHDMFCACPETDNNNCCPSGYCNHFKKRGSKLNERN